MNNYACSTCASTEHRAQHRSLLSSKQSTQNRTGRGASAYNRRPLAARKITIPIPVPPPGLRVGVGCNCENKSHCQNSCEQLVSCPSHLSALPSCSVQIERPHAAEVARVVPEPEVRVCHPPSFKQH
jgi:hypothetical protein